MHNHNKYVSIWAIKSEEQQQLEQQTIENPVNERDRATRNLFISSSISIRFE